ncbi:hypothetical protein E2562_015587 [Oryza meyeriana var. granulata]|uniref:Uncharacterized protein n=1 Tax=Oryza meyeriana var. granulata TaxID=110450 RepID=A0A6G1EK34_9ORYZ|nr:hypothetical protein E2562_015587 [Oryza meyeriana var. granulata]
MAAASSSRRGGGGARQSPFFRDLASPIPSHRAASRFASAAPTATPSATPPPPPLFTLDDRVAAADFSPEPTASDLLPVASSPSPRAAAASRSPSWDRSRGRVSAPGSPMDGVVEPPRKEVLALPPPSSPGTPAPPPPAAEAQSSVTPAAVAVAAGTEQEMNAGEHSYDARKALQKNGVQLSSGVIIGVKPIDPMHRQQLDESFTGNKQGCFMMISNRASAMHIF